MPAVISRMVTPTTEGVNSIGLDAAFSASKPTVSQAGVPTPIEIGVWIYNKHLTRDPKKRIAITSASTNQHLTCNLEDFLEQAVKLDECRQGQRTLAQTRVESVLVAINQHAKVIDVLIQQQPDITAVVWGAMRFLIGVAVKEIDTSESISKALVEIVESLGRWNKYIELFEDSKRVSEIASHLFSQIINFLVRARLYYQKPRAIRHAKVGFTSYARKFEDIMRIIGRHSHTLEREVSLASEIKRDNDRKARFEQYAVERKEFIKQEKFRNDLSLKLNQTKSNLEGYVDTQREEALINPILKWLLQYQISPPYVPNATEGTCTWIEQHEGYESWVEAGYNQPLCLFGPLGCGKSVIASYLATIAATCIIVPFFFQSVTNLEGARPVLFTASVLANLLQLEVVKSSPQYPHVLEQLTELSKSSNIMDEKFPFYQLWVILLELVMDMQDFTLIVDGLDECDHNSRTEFCLELIKLSSQSNARVVILFRNHSDLERVFQESFKIEITPSAVSEDILLYVNMEIQRNAKKLLELRREIVEAITQSCQGMFLWADMMLKCLVSAATRREQLRYLANCPPGLNAFYETLISNRTKSAQLTEDCLQRRRDIFLTLLRAFRALTLEEVSVVLALRVETTQLDEFGKLIDPEEEIMLLCWPLARISQCYVHIMHESVKEYLNERTNSINITGEDSDAYLARKSLIALSLEEYRSPNKIAILVRRNVAASAEQDDDKYFYQYAATHWFRHLIAISKPEPSLVKLAASFLTGNEFVSWAEFIFQLSGSQGVVLEVESKLKIWRSTLPEELKGSFPLKNYFTGPYRAAANYFGQEGGDKTLPFLVLFQLGEFLNLSFRREEAFAVKKTVAEGLVNLLGERDPLALKAESAYAVEFISRGLLREAEETFGRLAQIQREVIGEDRPDCYQSLQRQGMAQTWMTKFTEANMHLIESLAGFLKTVGPTNFLYLLSQQTLGCVMEAQGEWDRATLEYERVWRYRVSILGPDNPMAVWSRCAMVSSYRKTGRYEDADKAISEVIDSRKRTIGVKAPGTIDAIIQRIVLCRETGQRSEANELIDFIVDGGLVDELFERFCQVEHVRALLEVDAGGFESAVAILQVLVHQALEMGVKGRNRSMLWVILDLATILRRNKRENEALMLFDGIVTSIDDNSSSSWEEPQPPIELRTAEQALRLVRELKPEQADLLLQKNGLKWVRQEDFWILPGGPSADTGWMREPYSIEIRLGVQINHHLTAETERRCPSDREKHREQICSRENIS